MAYVDPRSYTFVDKDQPNGTLDVNSIFAADLNALVGNSRDANTRIGTLEASPGGGSGLDDSWIDIRDHGAVGDYNAATGVGTDSTTAIQAAVDAAAAQWRKVWIPNLHFKITAPIVLKGNSVVRGPAEYLRTAAISSGNGRCSINFHGGNGQNAFEAIGTAQTSISKLAIGGFSILDRRTQGSVTGGHGILIDKAVNNVTVSDLDIFGFWAGSKVRVTASVGSSDCANIENVWCVGEGLYGINVDSVDNYCLIRQIMHDTANVSTDIAMIRVDTGTTCAILIEGIKHENQNPNTVTLLIDSTARYVTAQGIISRGATFDGGPVVRINAALGSEALLMGIARSGNGTLLDVVDAVQPKTITGTRLPLWVGGVDGLHINTARLGASGTAGQEDMIFVQGRLLAALNANSMNDIGKVALRADSTTQKPLTIAGVASTTADYLRVYNSANTSLVRVDSTGKLITLAGLHVGGARTVGHTTVADTNYTVVATDYRIDVTSLTAPRTITLPAVSADRTLIIQDLSGAAGTNNITVARAGSALIDGATNVVISQNYGAVELYCNGTNWVTGKPPAAATGGGGGSTQLALAHAIIFGG